jgi:neutral ceramidase
VPTHYNCPLAVWQFGDDLTLVGFSGEVVAGYVPLVEDAIGPLGLWVAAYCNVMYGYVPTVRVIEEGGYETRGLEDGDVGQFAPEVETKLLDHVRALAARAREKVQKAREQVKHDEEEQ